MKLSFLSVIIAAILSLFGGHALIAVNNSQPAASAFSVMPVARVKAYHPTLPKVPVVSAISQNALLNHAPVGHFVALTFPQQNIDVVSSSTLAAVIANLRAEFYARLTDVSRNITLPQQVAAGGTYIYSSGFPAASQNVTNLSNVTLTSPTIVTPTLSGLSTSQVSEGSNLYYLDSRVANYISASSTIPNATGSLGNILSWNGLRWVATATSSLGVTSAGWGNITGTLSAQSDLQTALSAKLASTSLSTSALLAGLISDHTGSGPLAFAISPTFSGTPIFSGGTLNFSVASTSTIPDNTPGAWSLATSTTGAPLFAIDTTIGSESISLGAPGSSVIIGSAGQSSNLVFQENSFIQGAGSGRTITFGANADIFNFGVNLGIGTTTPSSPLAVSGGATIGADYNLPAPTNGLIVEGNVGVQNSSPNYALDVGGFINTSSSGGGYKIDGSNALYASSSASYLLAVGPGAGNGVWSHATSTSVTSGIYNTAIGYQALNIATSTNFSTAVGYQALKNTTLQGLSNGDDAFGYLALNANTYGSNNAAFGGYALQSNTTGGNNIGIGSQSVSSNTSGNSLVGIGFRALQNGITNSNNIGIGYWSMRYATSTSNNNVAIGYQAGLGNSTNYAGSTGNTLVGYQSGLNFNTGASYNALLGFQAGVDINTGSYNTVIGQSTTTGAGITTGTNNILIGNAVSQGLTQTGSNQLNIGNLLFGSSLGMGPTLSSGNIGIGTSTPGSLLSLNNVANFTIGTSTFYSTGGINLTNGCFSVNGACISGAGTSYTFSYPLLNTSNTISLSYGTTTSNSWSNQQTFSTALNISPTSGSVLAKLGGSNFIVASTTGNLVLGLSAGIAISDYASSTAFGYKTLQTATSSVQNTAIGYQALAHVTDLTSGQQTSGCGCDNTALGSNAMLALTTGTNNSAFGNGVLTALISSNNNVAFGDRTLESLLTGSDNIGIGFRTLGNNVTGSSNIGIGSDASRYNQSATNTVAIGYQTAGGITASNFAGVQGYTIIGHQAGGRITTGAAFNTFLGYEAGNLVTTGSDNILIGAASTAANDNLTTGNQNIKIGDNISLASTTANGQLNIQNIIFGTGNTAIGSTVSSGNIGIGTTTPFARLVVWGPDSAASTSAFVVANNASTTEFAVLDNGNATLAGNLIQSSDARLKTNIATIDGSSSLAAIAGLNPVTFNWIEPSRGFLSQYGFIAQEVQHIFPNLVSTSSPTALTPDGTLSLNYIDLISPIVGAIQELDKELSALTSTISSFADGFTTKELIFIRGQGDEIDVKKLCIGSTCVTESQLQALLAAANQSASTPTPPPSSSSTTPATSADVPPPVDTATPDTSQDTTATSSTI